MCLVSVVVTTKNRFKLLKRAVDSVLQQSYSNIECIVVDDGSEDETEQYYDSSKEVVYIRIPTAESKGGNYARNLGIKRAKGDVVAFLDDDDYWLSTKIEKQVDLFLKEPSVGVVVTGYQEVTKSGQILAVKKPSYSVADNLSSYVLYNILTVTSVLSVRRELLFQVGLFDEKLKFWQEYELTIRLAQLTKFAVVEAPLMIYLYDISDKQRLTNKYDGWVDAVHYIYAKHHELYDKLTAREKFLVKYMFNNSAISRSRNARKYMLSYFLKFKKVFYLIKKSIFRF